MNREISLHISHVIAYETNQQASAVVSSFLTISGNIERIGDHADNLAGYTRMLNRRDIAFSQTAQQEIVSMQDICLKGLPPGPPGPDAERGVLRRGRHPLLRAPHRL